MREKLESLFPVGSRRRKFAGKAYKIHTKFSKNKSNAREDYDVWMAKFEVENFDQKIPKSNIKISILVPCFNTPKKYIDPLLESVLGQIYENWELCLADGSDDDQKAAYIEKISKKDNRIKYRKVQNVGIVGNTNEALAMADGEFVAFLDHDDLLSPHALREVVIAIAEGSYDLIYSDEDKISDDGKVRQIPFFKPDWSPDLLLGVNYITHFTVARKKLVEEIGGLRDGFDGSQDYDFLLRITEKTDRIKHIPKILYHWRLADGSTAKVVSEKNYTDDAGRRALKDAVNRRGIKAEVLEIKDRPTNYRIRYILPKKQPLVSIIIPFKDKSDLLENCVESILDKTTYDNYEIILLSNNSTEEKTHALLAKYKKSSKCRVYYWDNPFNYSAINNFGRKKAKGEYIVLLNNDTEVITPEWLDELIGVASQKVVGAVGPLLYYPNRSIQHAGVVLGMTGMAGHVFRYRHKDEWTDFGLTSWPRNYLAVTGACLAINAKKYDEVGGLDEEFTIAGNDVALGIRLHEHGYRNIYWPFVELIHYENVSVGSYDNVPKSDYDHSLTYYTPYLKWKDPYFNPNLSLKNEQVTFREEL